MPDGSPAVTDPYRSECAAHLDRVAANGSLAGLAAYHKVYHIPLALLISYGRHGIPFANGRQQRLPR